MALPNKQNCTTTKSKFRRMLLATSGVFFLAIAVSIMILDPVQYIVQYNCRIANGSFLMDTFQTEVEGARLSVYIFNVTNSERFISGQDKKLKVEEVGPFTYVEIRHNIDVDLKADRGLMNFTPAMKLKFLPHESVADPLDVNITVPNLALLSAATLLSDYPSIIQTGFNLLASHHKAKAIISLDVHRYLWGYRDPLIDLANKIVPGLIYFDRFGIIDRLYENKTYYRMEVGTTDKDRFSIKTLKRYLKQNDSEAHRPVESLHFEDTYEGMAYPPNFSKNLTIKIYRIGVCRPLKLKHFNTSTMEYGPTVWSYRISNSTFEDCVDKVCGLLDLSACTYGTPIAMSRTHFLYADPKLYKRIEGIRPDPSLHDSTFVIDPKLGFALSTNLSLQLNIVLKDLRFNQQTKPFSDIIVPVSYIKVVQPELMENFKFMLKLVYFTGPKVVLALEILLFLLGIGLLGYSLLNIYRIWCSDDTNYIITPEKQTVPLIKSENIYPVDIQTKTILCDKIVSK